LATPGLATPGFATPGLATPGVAAAVGEVEVVSLIAGRRLQLACEKGGGTGLILHRRPYGGVRRSERPGSASASRWRVTSAPRAPAAGTPGHGVARWDVERVRCRGGQVGAWLMEEAPHGPHPFRLVAPLGDGRVEAPLRKAG
jgi:protein ImuA